MYTVVVSIVLVTRGRFHEALRLTLKLDFLTSAYNKCIALVRRSSFSKVQGLRETGPRHWVALALVNNDNAIWSDFNSRSFEIRAFEKWRFSARMSTATATRRRRRWRRLASTRRTAWAAGSAPSTGRGRAGGASRSCWTASRPPHRGWGWGSRRPTPRTSPTRCVGVGGR